MGRPRLTGMQDQDTRFETLRFFYRRFYEERRFEEGAAKLAAGFVNHHPGANRRGPAGMIADYTELGPPAGFRIEPVRMVADGDLVWVLARSNAGLAVDIWRFDPDGAIAEHWDVFRRLDPSEDPIALTAGLA